MSEDNNNYVKDLEKTIENLMDPEVFEAHRQITKTLFNVCEDMVEFIKAMELSFMKLEDWEHGMSEYNDEYQKLRSTKLKKMLDSLSDEYSTLDNNLINIKLEKEHTDDYPF